MCKIDISYFRSLSYGIRMRRLQGKMIITERGELPEEITQAEANAIAMAVLNGEARTL